MASIDTFVIKGVEYIKTDTGCFRKGKVKKYRISEIDYQNLKKIANRRKPKTFNYERIN